MDLIEEMREALGWITDDTAYSLIAKALEAIEQLRAQVQMLGKEPVA